MANFTITVPDDKVTGLVEAFAAQYGYKEFIVNEAKETVPNPVNKAQFAKNCIRGYIKEVYISAQLKAVEAQRATIIETSSTEIDVLTVE